MLLERGNEALGGLRAIVQLGRSQIADVDQELNALVARGAVQVARLDLDDFAPFFLGFVDLGQGNERLAGARIEIRSLVQWGKAALDVAREAQRFTVAKVCFDAR